MRNDLDQLESLNPKQQGLYVLMASLYLLDSNVADAKQALWTEIHNYPQDPRAYHFLASVQTQSHDDEGALNTWMTLLKAVP